MRGHAVRQGDLKCLHENRPAEAGSGPGAQADSRAQQRPEQCDRYERQHVEPELDPSIRDERGRDVETCPEARDTVDELRPDGGRGLSRRITSAAA